MRLYELRRSEPTVWRKSSYCAAGECLEVTHKGDAVLLRSNRAPRTVIRLSKEEWQAFSNGVTAGDFADIGEQ
jgi:hypothetical protein